MKLTSSAAIRALVELAIEEDLGMGDITSEITVPPGIISHGKIVVKQNCILCGQEIAGYVFQRLDASVEYQSMYHDGDRMSSGSVIARITGPTRSILSAERIALNFLQRLSGIASVTDQLVSLVKSTGCHVVDTRKTTPGWRMLEKYAVRMGGARNHRLNLGDGILIKENHILAAGGVGKSVILALQYARHLMKIQVEVKNRTEADEAVMAGAQALLLDNMTPSEVKAIADTYKGQVTLEASGNITPSNIREYAETGIDIISLGYITHSARSGDLSLLLE